MSDKSHPGCSVLSEAWYKVKGMKGAMWGSIFLFAVISMGGFALLAWFFAIGERLFAPELVQRFFADPMTIFDPQLILPVGALGVAGLYYLAHAVFEMLVLLPMRMGIRLIPLRRAVDKSVSALFIFKFLTWRYIWRFIILEFFITLMVGIPGTLSFLFFSMPQMHHLVAGLQITCVIAGALFGLFTVYFLVCYLFANLLIIDRKVSPWCAMEMSRQVISKRWFCVFGAIIWMGIALLIGAALLGIGLIWAIPYVQNVVALLYARMMGIEGHDPVTLSETLPNERVSM